MGGLWACEGAADHFSVTRVRRRRGGGGIPAQLAREGALARPTRAPYTSVVCARVRARIVACWDVAVRATVSDCLARARTQTRTRTHARTHANAHMRNARTRARTHARMHARTHTFCARTPARTRTRAPARTHMITRVALGVSPTPPVAQLRIRARPSARNTLPRCRCKERTGGARSRRC
jgi:hypothetical protein